MRTTLDLDVDVLAVVKEAAKFRGQTIGQVVSELLRKSLNQPTSETIVRNGVPLLPAGPPGSPKITSEMVNEWLNELD